MRPHLNVLPTLGSTSASPNAFAIDGATDRLAFVFLAEEDDTIADVGAYCVAVTGTAPAYTLGLQAIGTDGLPSGTYLASATFTPTAATWHWITLGSTVSVTAGTAYAVVITPEGTPGTSDYASFAETLGGAFYGRMDVPWVARDTGTGFSRAGAMTTVMPLFGYRSATKTYGNPILGTTTASSALTTSGRRACLKFQVPTDWGSTYRVPVMRLGLLAPSFGGTLKFGIWDASGTEIASTTLDTDAQYNQGQDGRTYRIPLVTRPDLDAGTDYYAGIEHTGTNASLDCLSLPDAGSQSALDDGDGLLLSTWDGSTWTDSPAQRPFVELMLSDLSGGDGGGGTYPDEDDVLTTAPAYGPTGTEFGGNYTPPDPDDVISTATFGVGNAEAGTYVATDPEDVLITASFGPSGSIAGTVTLPDVAVVLAGETFGPDLSLTGTATNNTDATIAQIDANITTLLGRVTAARMGTLDIAGTVASSGDVSSILGRLGTPAGASVSADIAAISAGTLDVNVVEVLGTAVEEDTSPVPASVEGYATGQDPGTLVWGATTRTLSSGANIALAKGTGITGFNDITAASVWGVARSGNQTTGTFGEYIDAAVSDAGGGLDAAGVRAAVGLAAANLDTQLAAIDDYLDTEVAAIKAKTDNLPAAFPADFASLAIDASGRVQVQYGTSTGQINLSGGNLAAAVPAVSGNVLGKVLGGGGSTITGPGVWALDDSGAALPTASEIAAAVRDVDNTTPAADSLGAAVNASASGGLDPQDVADLVVAAIDLDASLASLQSHGDSTWSTATGFSTHTAADVWAVATRTITGGTVSAVSDKTGYSLASSGLDSVAIETGVNARQALSVVLASAAGVLSGAATSSITIQGGNVATTRITATTDADGNRTAVTLSLPS